MRSIGKRNIKKLNQIVDEVMKEKTLSFYTPSATERKERIVARIPEAWYEIWESAWAEINRLIDDRMMENLYAKSA